MKGGVLFMKKVILPIFFIGVLVFMAGFSLAAVNGAQTVTSISNSTALAGSPESHDAIAGNVTEIQIFGESVTQTWQGYFGNVSGAITLENAAGNAMYNWSLASPEGEIYASPSNNVAWASIECFNWTANGTTVESAYNIGANDADGINETFSNTVHPDFATGTKAFNNGECMSTEIFSQGAGSEGTFDEVLLWDGSDLVFAAILEKDAIGFDGNPYDFQMIVVEDGHNGDTTTTPYYFYVELA
jgi:hypothetical protein